MFKTQMTLLTLAINVASVKATGCFLYMRFLCPLDVVKFPLKIYISYSSSISDLGLQSHGNYMLRLCGGNIHQKQSTGDRGYERT